MNSSFSAKKTGLPVPELFLSECSLFHSRKQGQKRPITFRNAVRPPKLLAKHDGSFSNRSFGSLPPSGAHAISFNGKEDSLKLSRTYDKEKSGRSYYEQCFEPLELLGEGSFGEVFKVRSKDNGKLYAIKKSKQLFRGELYRQERLEEVRRYEQFSHHENCVTLYKAWEEEDRLYMQMELCRGSMEDLAWEYAEKGVSVPEERIWSFLLDLTLALKGLHDKNLVHLDVKLDNVLISEDDVCKLADFGLVFDLTQKNLDHATEGDSRYIAPELLQGNFSKAADIFSLGICVLELASGIQLESGGPLWQQLRDGVISDDCFLNISSDLASVIRRMMKPDPAERPDINELSRHPKLVLLQQSRQSCISKLRGAAKRTLRCILNFIQRVFLVIYCWFKIAPKKTHNSSCGSELESDSLQVTPTINLSGLPVTFPQVAKIVNSTPLNSSGSNFRLRHVRDQASFSRTTLGFDSDEDDEGNLLSSTMNKSGMEAGNHENSSIICKKLFVQDE